MIFTNASAPVRRLPAPPGGKNAMPLALLLMIVCPLAALPLLLCEIARGRGWALSALSFFMALCAILSPPFADLYQHSQYYREAFYFPSAQFIQTNGQDFVLYTLSQFFARHGVHFEFIRALFVFTCYQISFKLYKELLSSVPELRSNARLRWWVFVCFYFSVPFIWIVNGLRSATSDYLMILGWFLIYRRRYVGGIALALLSVWTHFFAIIFIPFLMLPLLRRVRLSRGMFVLLLLASIMLGATLLTGVMAGAGEDRMSTVGVSSGNAQFYMEDLNYSKLSAGGLIALFLERSPLIVLLLLVLKRGQHFALAPDLNYVYALYLLFGLIITYFVPVQRLAWLVYPIIMFLYLKNQGGRPWLWADVRWLLFANILLQFAYLYGYREVFLQTPFYYLLLPVAFPLWHTYPLDFNLAG